jgi:hypothetical protein
MGMLQKQKILLHPHFFTIFYEGSGLQIADICSTGTANLAG